MYIVAVRVTDRATRKGSCEGIQTILTQMQAKIKQTQNSRNTRLIFCTNMYNKSHNLVHLLDSYAHIYTIVTVLDMES